jgi:hypothetical protein
MTVKTPAEMAATLVFLVSENDKLNEGKPKDNLHVTGHLLPGFNYCSSIRVLRWALGEANPVTGRPAEFPYSHQDERETLRSLADRLANSKLPAGSLVNNW